MEDAEMIFVGYRTGPKLQIPLPSPKGLVVAELELPGNRAGVPNRALSCRLGKGGGVGRRWIPGSGQTKGKAMSFCL